MTFGASFKDQGVNPILSYLMKISRQKNLQKNEQGFKLIFRYENNYTQEVKKTVIKCDTGGKRM